jgi:predicted RNA-binding Zn-ribbon protein involved in translation (DUF1610 family)
MRRGILNDEGFDGQYWVTDAQLLNPKRVKIGHTQSIVVVYHFEAENGERYDQFTFKYIVKRLSDGFRFQCPQCGKWDERLFLCKETRKKFVCEACFTQVWNPGDPDDPKAKFVNIPITDAAQLAARYTKDGMAAYIHIEDR